METDKISYLQ